MLEGRRFSTQQHECQAGKIDLNSAICESHCCGSSALYSRLFHIGVEGIACNKPSLTHHIPHIALFRVFHSGY